GVVRADRGELNMAIADFSRAIVLNPEYAESYYNRGIAKRRIGDAEGAKVDRARAAELDPKYKK
ncbi:MAG: tetratricopeptide repeat protein, partial [Sphingomicrobium sp.]